MEWQPIETAPMPKHIFGPDFLLMAENGVTVGHWTGSYEMWEQLGGGLLEPSHWMLLPQPPASTNG